MNLIEVIVTYMYNSDDATMQTITIVKRSICSNNSMYHKGAIAPLYNYRDRGGWPALLPYIRKIRVSVAIGNQSGIRLHERVPTVKIWGSSKMTKIR